MDICVYFADKLTQTENGITKNKFSKKDLEGIILSGEKLAGIQQKLTHSGFVPNGNKGAYKHFHVGVSVAAVVINFCLLTFFVPLFNQFLSRKIISKEVNGKKSNKNQMENIAFGQNNKSILTQFLNKTQPKDKPKLTGKTPSFKGLKDLIDIKALTNFAKVAEDAQLNPTASMLWLDYGISGSRVTYVPRDNNERIEYIVKEGGILLMFYYAADLIKKGISLFADKVLNKPIDLDYKIIGNKEFADKLKTPHKKDSLLKFTEGKGSELDVIKLIDQELAKAPQDANISKESIFKNFTLQMAQKEGLIDVEFDDSLKCWIRHSKKYIDTEKLVDLNNNLKNFYEKSFDKVIEYGEKPISKINVEKAIAKTKALKGASIFGNIAICCFSLSYLLPKLQYFIREQRTKTTQAPGIKVYHEMAEKKLI